MIEGAKSGWNPKRFCEHYKYMDCPKPYSDLCTEHVVVMDYVEGISVSHPESSSKRATI